MSEENRYTWEEGQFTISDGPPQETENPFQVTDQDIDRIHAHWQEMNSEKGQKSLHRDSTEFAIENFELQYDDATYSIVIPWAGSGSKDRVGDVTEVNGIDMTNHRKNPIVYLDHKAIDGKPIGKCEDPDGNYTCWVDEETGLAWAKIYLAVGVPDFPEPLQVYELYKRGFLKAGSFRYRVIDADMIPPDPKTGHFKKSMHLKKTELLEVSVVSLPCNQDTVKQILGSRPDWTENIKSLLLNTGMGQKDEQNMSEDDDTSADDAKGEVVEPLGKTLCQKLCKGIDELHESVCDDHGRCEHPKVKKAIGKHLEALKGMKGEIEELHNKEYNESEEGADAEEEDVESDGEHEEKPAPEENVEKGKRYKPTERDRLLHEIQDHLADLADHPETPNELRKQHKYFADQTKSLAPDADVDFLKEYLDECAECSPKLQASAHKYYAARLKKFVAPELTPQEQKEVLSRINDIQANQMKLKTKIFRVTGA